VTSQSLFFYGLSDIISLPHIGASTAEAEENCAIMAADQIMDYLENGNIKNSINFPRSEHGKMQRTAHHFCQQKRPKSIRQRVRRIEHVTTIRLID
jgi:D-3-phosphoglycerate dehydrogenase